MIFIDDATAGEASASASSRGPLAYAGGGALSSYGGADTAQAGGVKLSSVPLTGAYQPSNFGGLVRLQRGRTGYLLRGLITWGSLVCVVCQSSFVLCMLALRPCGQCCRLRAACWRPPDGPVAKRLGTVGDH